MPDNFPNRDAILATLFLIYEQTYEATGDKQYLDEMVEFNHLALSRASVNKPIWIHICQQAVRNRWERYCDFDNEEDFDEAIKLYNSGWNNVHETPSVRIMCALKAASILTQKSNWEESFFVFEKAIKLLPKVSLRSLKNQNKQLVLEDLGSIACDVVAISLNVSKSPSEALHMLKFDRGIIAGSLLKMRTDVFELR